MEYFPFLKAKMNEVSGVAELSSEALQSITPFFDIPKPKDDTEEATAKAIQVSKKHLTKYFPDDKDYYLDIFDLNPLLRISGYHVYDWTLGELTGPNLIPVVGLDRDPDHLKSVINYLKNGKETSRKVCIRLLRADFEDYELVEDDLKDLISQIEKYVDDYDIALDSRIVSSAEVNVISKEMKSFLDEIYAKLNPRRCFIASSSISPITSEYVRPSSEAHLRRSEKEIWSDLSSMLSGAQSRKVFYGDYGVVSPNYSDPNISPGLFNTVSTPKALYTYDHGYFAVRGGSFKTHGREQYYDLADIIVSKNFFRGAGASAGDSYISESAKRLTKKGSAGSWIKNTLISHIEFVHYEIRSGAI